MVIMEEQIKLAQYLREEKQNYSVRLKTFNAIGFKINEGKYVGTG